MTRQATGVQNLDMYRLRLVGLVGVADQVAYEEPLNLLHWAAVLTY